MATRATSKPIIDGQLDDPAWQAAAELGAFTQYDPNNGRPATQATTVKVVYDDDAIYFGAFLHDTQAVTTLLGRRDTNLESDWFRISVDPERDRLSGASFWVNPSNVQVDMTLYADLYEDWTWDAVWESAARIVPGGWIAEVRIPYSQLRFPPRERHVWGINLARRTVRTEQVDRLVNTPKTEAGIVSRFGDLVGIEGIAPKRAFEVVPYAVARNDMRSRFDANDPFLASNRQSLDGGVDLKYGLSSSLTLTGTINPDFGQVEVDPAVLNLTQFETFFPEKRPFFTEGAQLFRFGIGPARTRISFGHEMPTFFYTRRMGRTPQGAGAISADYLDVPAETTILGAAKITGKFGNGWSVGLLDAVTDREDARYDFRGDTPGGRRAVEPLTNYFVARMARELGEDHRVGFLATAVHRKNPDELSFLRDSAYTFGIDGYSLLR